MHFYKRSSAGQDISLTALLMFPLKWKKYKRKFKKSYKNEAEETMRRQIFFQRYTLVEQHNKKFEKKMVPFKITTTALTDRTDDELALLCKEEIEDDDDCNCAAAEWEHFKSKKRKKFKSDSFENIPKYFFLAKMNEIKIFENDLRKSGLAVDKSGMDRYCDFTAASGVKSRLDDLSMSRVSFGRTNLQISTQTIGARKK